MSARAKAYAYVVTIVRALKSRFLTVSQFETILKTKDEREAIRALSETPYAPHVSGFVGKAFVTMDFEKMLSMSYHDVYKEVVQLTESRVARNLLTYVYTRHELDSLKVILRCAASGTHPDQAMEYVSPIGRYTYEFCAELLKRRDLAKVAETIEDVDLRRALTSSIQACKKVGSSLPAEAAIDRYFYTTAWTLAEKFKEVDRTPVRLILGTEADIANIDIAIRSKQIMIPSSLLKDMILPIRYRLRTEFDQALEMANVIDAIRALSSGFYRGPLSGVVDSYKRLGSLHHMELTLKRYLASRNLSAFIGYPFQVGILLAFLNLKLFETRDIRAIVLGKRDGIAADRLKDFLVTYGLF